VALIFQSDIHLMIAHRKSAMFELVQRCSMISCIVVPLAEQRIDPIAQQTQDGYDQSGNVKYTDGRVLVESVYRFKGQAADAVILTEVEFADLDQKNRRKLFVAFSRARLHVTFITSERARDALLTKTNPA